MTGGNLIIVSVVLVVTQVLTTLGLGWFAGRHR